MLTRRSLLAGVGGLYVAARASRLLAAATGLKTSVAFDVPHGACDTHVHVIGDPAEFPMSPEREYTPPPATADQLLEVQKALKLDRVVIVTPGIYDDNSATLAAIKQLGLERARGVAFVAGNTPSEALDSMRAGGIAGIRLLPAGTGAFDPAAGAKHLDDAIEIAKSRAWHLQIATPPDVIAALATQLASCPVPVVLDTFGWVAGGVEQPGFETILSLMRSGRAYVKLTQPYRISKKPPNYQDLIPLVRALLAANPDRLLWGSGWPNVRSEGLPGHAKTDLAPNLPVDVANLLNLLAVWVPDVETRRKILVDNPARLYGF